MCCHGYKLVCALGYFSSVLCSFQRDHSRSQRVSPLNYVRPRSCVCSIDYLELSYSCSSEDEVVLKGDPHCVEAGESLREWREHWHRLYIVSAMMHLYSILGSVSIELLLYLCSCAIGAFSSLSNCS